MIEYIEGDMLHADVEALVNTVNCVGIMGRGIALQFKNAYPDNFIQYKQACDRGDVVPGRMFIYETGTLTNPKYIINFPTKRHWKGKSRIEDIEAGLNELARDITARNITSIAIPPLGSGLGGLSWLKVRGLIQQKIGDVKDLRVVVYEPSDVRVATKSFEVPSMNPSRAITIKLIDRYLKGLMDPFVSLLEVQKLMYFIQACGEPLNLQYEKGQYGPYAPSLRHILRALEGHYIAGYGDGGDNPTKPLRLVPGAVKDANDYLHKNSLSTLTNLDKVSRLVSGFETSFGLELLATVHWVVNTEHVRSEKDLVMKVYGWNKRKQRFSRYQILQAHGQLQSKGLCN